MSVTERLRYVSEVPAGRGRGGIGVRRPDRIDDVCVVTPTVGDRLGPVVGEHREQERCAVEQRPEAFDQR